MANKLAYGADVKAWFKTEATFNTIQAMVAGDAVSPVGPIKIEPMNPWEATKERAGTASRQGFVRKKSSVKWSGQFYVKPNAAGTAPDIGEALKHAFGTETPAALTSTTYSHNDTDPSSIQFVQYAGDGLYEVVTGACIEQVDIDIQNDSPVIITLSGTGAVYGWAFACTVNTNASSSATTVFYTTAHKGAIGKNARIKFGTEDNAGAGYLVTAVDDSTSPPSITISPGLANGISASDNITPVVPSQTVSGTILNAIGCGFSLDATTLDFLSAKYSYKTGKHLRMRDASQSVATGVLRGDREVNFEAQMLFESQSTGPFVGRSYGTLDITRAVILRIGENTAAKRATLNIPAWKITEAAQIEIPETDEIVHTLKGTAKQSAAAADESTFVFA